MFEKGVVDALLSVLVRHEDSAAVVEQACWALKNIAAAGVWYSYYCGLWMACLPIWFLCFQSHCKAALRSCRNLIIVVVILLMHDHHHRHRSCGVLSSVLWRV